MSNTKKIKIKKVIYHMSNSVGRIRAWRDHLAVVATEWMAEAEAVEEEVVC